MSKCIYIYIIIYIYILYAHVAAAFDFFLHYGVSASLRMCKKKMLDDSTTHDAHFMWKLRSLTLAQNLKGVMSEALLSRFDIIFLMRTEDDPNQDMFAIGHSVFGS